MKLKSAMKKSSTGKKLRGKISGSSSTSSQKVKSKSSRARVHADALKWKSVKTASFGGMDEGGGMMMLEELDGVGIEWEEDQNGSKVARFVVRQLDRTVSGRS